MPKRPVAASRRQAWRAPPRPAERPLPGCRGGGGRDRPGRALVEHHGDVHPHPLLRGDHRLGGEAQRRAVEVAAEGHAARVHRAQGAEAPDLEAAAVGEDRAAPAGEGVKAAEPLDDVDARAQGEVVEVGEHDRGAGLLELLRRHPLDRAQGAHRHERRRLDHAVGSGEPARGAPRRRCRGLRRRGGWEESRGRERRRAPGGRREPAEAGLSGLRRPSGRRLGLGVAQVEHAGLDARRQLEHEAVAGQRGVDLHVLELVLGDVAVGLDVAQARRAESARRRSRASSP